MVRKNAKRIVFVAVIVAALILFVPFPQKIVQEYRGVDTVNGEKADITLDITYLRFLALRDKMTGTISVKSDTEELVYGDSLFYQGMYSVREEDCAHFFSGWYFDEGFYMRRDEFGTVGRMIIGSESTVGYISADFDKILLLHEDKKLTDSVEPVTQKRRRFIGAVSEDAIPDALDYFTGHFDEKG